MAEKDRVCKQCGFLTTSKECESCGSNQFLDKYKGKVIVFKGEESEIAKKLNIKNSGKFALKYG